jgi:hypothetical protein
MFFFGDGFDLYAAPADANIGGSYWDGGSNNFSIVAGRFSGSRAVQVTTISITTPFLLKNSGANDTVHKFTIAIQQTVALSGTNPGTWLTLSDGATAQCSVVFRSDGAILLTAGASNGTTLATYTSAITAINTWYGFEIEVVVSNTAGSMTVRKNGNPSNDFASATNLDTAQTANNYANRLGLGNGQTSLTQQVDDLLWRSDASSMSWVGDVRCYTRMPVSDASVQWTPSGAVVPMAAFPGSTNASVGFGANAFYLPFTPPCDGTIASLSLQCVAAATANFKCSLYASAAGAPTTVLGSANIVTNPGIGTVTFTFSTPVTVSRGVTYYAAFRGDASSGAWAYSTTAPAGGYVTFTSTVTYAAFPVANPSGLTTGNNYLTTVNITPTAAVNAPMVADTMQDAAVTYVSSSTVGQTDLYGIAPISGTPTGIIAVTTRALVQKSDAGTRNVALRLRSGATDVTGTSTALNTSWGWIFRTDTTDPATGAAWTPTGVNNLIIGETVTA